MPGHPLIAATLDWTMAGMKAIRRDLIPEARGRVLEIGVGTGLNLPFYGTVASLTAIEPDPHMRRRAQKRAQKLGKKVDLRDASAEALPFPDASFDTVVATFVLCTIPDPEAALREMRRVLVPGGRLLLAEHTRSRFPRIAGMQDGLNPVWQRFAGGCQLNRDVAHHLEGFTVTLAPRGSEKWTLAPIYAGVATKR